MKNVTFQISNGSYTSFYGDRRLNLIRPRKELDKKWLRRDGDQHFLFNVQGEGKKKIVVDCIPKVCEFADVFQEELPGLPSHR